MSEVNIFDVKEGHYYQEPKTEAARLRGLQKRAREYTAARKELMSDKAKYFKQLREKIKRETSS